MRFALSLIAGLASVASASAQFGNLTYNFFGPAGTSTQNSVSAISFPSSLSAVGVTNEPTDNMVNSRGWSNQATADLGKYYTFNFTTAQAISIPSINMIILSSNTGPTAIDLRSSLDGFTSTLGTQPISQGAATPLSFGLPASTFGNIATSTNVEFRIYGYSASNSGNSQLGFISSSLVSNSLSIPIAAPVPEPISILACSAFSLGAFGFARRRLVKK